MIADSFTFDARWGKRPANGGRDVAEIGIMASIASLVLRKYSGVESQQS